MNYDFLKYRDYLSFLNRRSELWSVTSMGTLTESYFQKSNELERFVLSSFARNALDTFSFRDFLITYEL